MSFHSRPLLPPQLSAKLESLGARLEYGPYDRELNNVLTGLAALPPNLIVRVSREIAMTAQLVGWRPKKRFSLMRLFRKPMTAKDLLRKNADYAWLFLFHTDGYVREAALDAIVKPPTSPFFFAALAWRLNDWAEPVRKAAKRCAMRVLPLADTNIAVIGALYLLDRRLVWGRWSDELEALDDFFARKDIIAALVVQLRERTTGPLATCLRHAVRYPGIDEHLPVLAANAIQPTVRTVAYKYLLDGKVVWQAGNEWVWINKAHGLRRHVFRTESREIQRGRPVAELIRQAIADRSPKVRSLATDALCEVRAQMPDADSLISRLARDRSYSVRWRADYMVRHPLTPSS